MAIYRVPFPNELDVPFEFEYSTTESPTTYANLTSSGSTIAYSIAPRVSLCEYLNTQGQTLIYLDGILASDTPYTAIEGMQAFTLTPYTSQGEGDPQYRDLNNSYTHNNKTVYYFVTGGNGPSAYIDSSGPINNNIAVVGDYLSQIAWLMVYGNNELIEGEDPYSGGGNSGIGGGSGNFDGTSEDINIPNLPTLSAVDTGFISLFNPTAGELKNLANYLWGDVFDISTWKKIFADPMDAILGLSIVPVNVPSSGSSAVTIGNISTGVSMTKASSQYVSVDCGTINVNEYWGAYLDYSPYTQAEIYLPFIGIHPLTIDDIMGKPVHVVYHIDVLSGACCAYVKCGGSVLYSFVGQCSCSIPITANDWTNVINGALSIAGAIGSMVASGGATAPMAVSSMASTAVNSLKPNVEKSGSMGGMGGMLGVQKPYIILTRPKQALPARQNTFTGYPSYITKKLSSCSGYTEVESIHLENVPATDNELSEITDLLKSGVII